MKSASLTRVALVALAALVGMAGLPRPAEAAGPRMSYESAVKLCTKRAQRFGRMPYGRGGDEPPPARVEREYRACVYANSHQYPSAPPRYRGSILKDLGGVLK